MSDIDESPCLCGAATVGGVCTEPDCVVSSRCTFRLTLDQWGTPARCERFEGHRGPHTRTLLGEQSLWNDRDRYYVQRGDVARATCYEGSAP